MYRILDLYCGAGGATYGFLKCDFEVVGIDAKHQPRYPKEATFIKRNVLGVPVEFMREFDFVFASPPCQAYVTMSHRSDHHNLIPATRELLKRAGVPWVIENIPAAPLFKFITLCGTMFPPLRVVRHRRFEYSDDILIRQPYHIPKDEHPRVYSFDRRKGRKQGLNEDEHFITVAGNNASLGAMSEAMGIWWMTRPEIAQAVPPRYATYIGKELIKNAVKSQVPNVSL